MYNLVIFGLFFSDVMLYHFDSDDVRVIFIHGLLVSTFASLMFYVVKLCFHNKYKCGWPRCAYIYFVFMYLYHSVLLLRCVQFLKVML